MLNEDQNGGSEIPSTEVTSPEVATPEVQSQEPQSPEPTPTPDAPLNPVSAALEAFEAAKTGDPLQLTAQTKPQPKPRTFEGLEPEFIPAFKHMRNEVYDKLYPWYIESKKLKDEHAKLQQQLQEQSGAHFYEQEGAWTLSPEYQEKAQVVSQLSRETEYWQEQLANIESGGQWSPLMYDPDTGKFFKGPEQEPTPQAKAQVLAKLTQANTMLGQHNAELQNFEGNFKTKHQNYVSSLKGIEEKVFGKDNLEKLTKHAGKKLEMFPPHMRGRPETQLLAKALVLIDGLIATIRQKQGAANTNTMKAATAKSSGPVNAQSGAGGQNGGKVGDVLDLFNKAKAGMV